MDWDQHLETLEIWAMEKNYFIDFKENGDDCICFESKLIEINSSDTIENQVIHLLHECGHVLLFENGSASQFCKKRFSYPENTIPGKVFTVLDESEAWLRAKKLAQRLSIPISDLVFEAEMIYAIYEYIKWASEKGDSVES